MMQDLIHKYKTTHLKYSQDKNECSKETNFAKHFRATKYENAILKELELFGDLKTLNNSFEQELNQLKIFHKQVEATCFPTDKHALKRQQEEQIDNLFVKYVEEYCEICDLKKQEYQDFICKNKPLINHNPERVKELIEMGFDKDTAKAALNIAKNTQDAINIILETPNLLIKPSENHSPLLNKIKAKANLFEKVLKKEEY
jgi:hypothetical protein